MSIINIRMMSHPMNYITLAVWVLFIVWGAISLGFVPHPDQAGKFATSKGK